MNVSTIFFDFGNVIAYFDHRRAFEPLAAHTTLSTEEMIDRIVAGELEEAIETGRMQEQEYLVEVKARCHLDCDLDTIRQCLAEIFWGNSSVCELIPRLSAHYPLYLLSNTNIIHARRFRDQFASTLSHFRSLILSYEVGCMKPHSGIYEHAERMAGSSTDSLLFIDDRPENIHAARDRGWNGIVYTGTESLKQQWSDFGISL